jgi:hypothetical protein
MFTEGVPLVVEDVTAPPAAERAEMLADPASAGTSPTDVRGPLPAGRAGTTPG